MSIKCQNAGYVKRNTKHTTRQISVAGIKMPKFINQQYIEKKYRKPTKKKPIKLEFEKKKKKEVERSGRAKCIHCGLISAKKINIFPEQDGGFRVKRYFCLNCKKEFERRIKI